MEHRGYKVQRAWKEGALIDNDTYLKWYADSIKNPDRFWGKHGKRIDWFKPFSKVKNTSFDGKVSIKWFEDGLTNVSYNCIDRHLKKRGNQIAIIWEGDNPYDDKKGCPRITEITVRDLAKRVSGNYRNTHCGPGRECRGQYPALILSTPTTTPLRPGQ